MANDKEMNTIQSSWFSLQSTLCSYMYVVHYKYAYLFINNSLKEKRQDWPLGTIVSND